MESLTVPEFFLLLSVDDDTQMIQIPYQSNIEMFIAINIFLELYLQKYIYIDHEFNIRRTVKSSNILYLQQTLDATQHLGDKYGIKMWLLTICSKQQLTHKLYHSVLECIQRKKQIKIIEKCVLGISFQKKYNCLQTKDQILTFLRQRSLEGGRQYLSTLTLFLIMDLNGMLKSKRFQSNYEYLIQLEECNKQLPEVTFLRKVIIHVKETLPSLLIGKHAPFSSM
ncbi:hypothetical protein D0U04_20615 [Bacillus clarus]|uniref:Uncharacterized protein n=1 Tax=Bacillus clarus TaxID=2338372 RepID=A0A090YY58_9BACI|nr:hypothetical protein [Bacillus clarus]KFN02895.1 hypothetical protein DJ93_5200 [Bacillus clarus]RFT64992.1 hypothetical protein D0U04_20615 [Bacillus clarus]